MTQIKASARWCARSTGMLGLALCLWAFLYPVPYLPCVAICAAAPWVALAGLFLFPARPVPDRGRDGMREGLAMLAFPPAMMVGARGVWDFRLLDWQPALIVAAAVSALWTVLFVFSIRSERPRRLVGFATGLLLFGGLYGYGVAVMANGLGDRKVVASYTVPVLDKHSEHGLSLKLRAWGTQSAQDESVGLKTYRAVVIGKPVCIDVHPGRLGFRWYQIKPCSKM